MAYVRSLGSRCHYCATNKNYHCMVISSQVSLPSTMGTIQESLAGRLTMSLLHSTTRCIAIRAVKPCQWLQQKYGTLEALNEAWGTVFWSQTYETWDQVIIPRKTVASHNPSLLLDFYRFSSDMKVEFQARQLRILRHHSTSQFVTHNLMGLFPEIDYYDLGADIDFVSWDNYPRYSGAPDSTRLALSHDLMRGIRKQNFWVMEEQSGPSGWEIVHSTPRPGEIRLWTYQAVSRGADGIVYFRWRTCRFGTEEYWHGIIDHDGRPRRRYREIQETGKELAELWPFLDGTEVKNDVAILYSYDQLWSLQIQPNNPSLQYTEIVKEYYKRLHELNIGVDLLTIDEFTDYKILIALLYLMTPELALRPTKFVESGGILVTTFRSGEELSNVVIDKPYWESCRSLIGCRDRGIRSSMAKHQLYQYGAQGYKWRNCQYMV